MSGTATTLAAPWQVRLRGQLITRTALRVGAGRSYDLLNDDLPVVKDTLKRPVIPGSSVKGALRGYTESLLRSLSRLIDAQNPSLLACDPLVDPCISQEQVSEIKAKGGDVDSQLLKQSCCACRLFGSPWLASRVLVKDLAVVEMAWFGQYDHRDGVSLDRDKGTAQAKHLYTFEAVPEKTPFRFELVLDGASAAELGLLLLSLEGFIHGQIPLGGARSRGLGSVELQMDWGGVEAISRENALTALGGRVTGAAIAGSSWTEDQRDAWIVYFLDAIHLPQAAERWQGARQSAREVLHGQ